MECDLPAGYLHLPKEPMKEKVKTVEILQYKQLTLGELIEKMESLSGANVPNLLIGGSYRGYYNQFYFELGEGEISAIELADDCRSVIGNTYEGYKGGEYTMTENTPVWLAEYGRSGLKIAEVSESRIVTLEDS